MHFLLVKATVGACPKHFYFGLIDNRLSPILDYLADSLEESSPVIFYRFIFAHGHSLLCEKLMAA